METESFSPCDRKIRSPAFTAWDFYGYWKGAIRLLQGVVSLGFRVFRMLQGYHKAAIRSYEFRGVSQGESSGAFLFLPTSWGWKMFSGRAEGTP